MTLSITVTANTPEPGTMGRKVDGWIRETAKAEAEFHQSQHTKLHFRRGASTRYGYKRRSSKYVKEKRRITGQAQPLVFSGATRESVQQNFKVQGTSTRGAKLTRVAAFKGGSGRYRLKDGLTTLTRQQEVALQLVEEIRAITVDEVNEIGSHGARVYDDFVEVGLSAGRRRKLG
jgi:hypothetical protein